MSKIIQLLCACAFIACIYLSTSVAVVDVKDVNGTSNPTFSDLTTPVRQQNQHVNVETNLQEDSPFVNFGTETEKTTTSSSEQETKQESKRFNLIHIQTDMTPTTDPAADTKLSKEDFMIIMKTGGLRQVTKNNGTLGQCSWVAEGYCCSVGTPCCCDKPAGSPGQCSSVAYEYCCHVGTPCICCSDKSQKKHKRNEIANNASSPHVVVLKDKKILSKATFERIMKGKKVVLRHEINGGSNMLTNNTLGNCAWPAKEYCCHVGTTCQCKNPPTAPGQCSETAWAYCCAVGTPCMCAAINLNAISVNVSTMTNTNSSKNFNLDIVDKIFMPENETDVAVRTPPQKHGHIQNVAFDRVMKRSLCGERNFTNATKKNTLGCTWAVKAYCCQQNKCHCRKGPKSPGQCSEVAYDYCCTMCQQCMCTFNATSDNALLANVITFNTATALQVALSFMCIVLLLVGIASCISCIQIHTKHKWEPPNVIDSNVITYKRL
eukprot:g4105.t1